MTKLNHIVNLIVGDWSADGHGLTEIITIHTNLSKKDIESAFKNGSRKINIDFENNLCSEYGDNTIDKEEWNKFIVAGLKLENLDGLENWAIKGIENDLKMQGKVHVWSELFAHLYLFVVKLGNVDFQYKFSEHDTSNINIGGYGLFN